MIKKKYFSLLTIILLLHSTINLSSQTNKILPSSILYRFAAQHLNKPCTIEAHRYARTLSNYKLGSFKSYNHINNYVQKLESSEARMQKAHEKGVEEYKRDQANYLLLLASKTLKTIEFQRALNDSNLYDEYEIIEKDKHLQDELKKLDEKLKVLFINKTYSDSIEMMPKSSLISHEIYTPYRVYPPKENPFTHLSGSFGQPDWKDEMIARMLQPKFALPADYTPKSASKKTISKEDMMNNRIEYFTKTASETSSNTYSNTTSKPTSFSAAVNNTNDERNKMIRDARIKFFEQKDASYIN